MSLWRRKEAKARSRFMLISMKTCLGDKVRVFEEGPEITNPESQSSLEVLWGDPVDPQSRIPCPSNHNHHERRLTEKTVDH